MSVGEAPTNGKSLETNNQTNNQTIGDQSKALEQDKQTQLQLLDLQRRTNAQNTMFTALTTMEKGKDDVLRAIANNLK